MIIRYIDRLSKQEHTELVYGGFFLRILYGERWWEKILSFVFLPLICASSIASHLYGWIQKRFFTKAKIAPFIRRFNVDTSEFAQPVSSYKCFNDFFIRKIKPRPLAPGADVALIPADGRYLVYENIHACDGFWIKGHKFHLEELLNSPILAHKYAHGSIAIARLAPPDYHRFHFPADCEPDSPQEIHGKLYSVSPIALRRNIHYLTTNKRVLTPLHTHHFGTILYLEIGATYVGTIHQTFAPGQHQIRGAEKGYFSFGGSCVILLFEPFRITFDADLISNSHRKIETLCKFGQSLGKAFAPL
ncbi:MAG: phosphatidylserine decarboxylase [Verrucomicrobia bacterium]|nr:phosphatidylserine decarboxylase [Verrucomicrobiota bacterium]